MPMPVILELVVLGTCSSLFSVLAATHSPKPVHSHVPQQDAVKDCIKEDVHLHLPEGFGAEPFYNVQVFLSYSRVAVEEGTAAAQSVVSEGGKKIFRINGNFIP